MRALLFLLLFSACRSPEDPCPPGPGGLPADSITHHGAGSVTPSDTTYCWYTLLVL